MKTLKNPFKTLIALLGLALMSLGIFPATGRADVSFSFFYDSLESQGDWLEVGDYGYCWRPRVDRDWRPYTDGYWTYTDYGWTWVSYEDFGGVTYHYGRWAEVEDEGWVWVPGYQWAPAWVSWRRSDDYVGWAPLPPETRMHGGLAVSFSFGPSVDYDYDIGPACFNFVPVRHFGSPVMRPVIVDRSENVTIVNKTVNVTNVVVNKNKKNVYNYGPDYNFVASRAERPIRKMKVVRETNVDVKNVAALRAKAQGDQLIVPAPNVVETKEPVKPKKFAPKIAAPKVDRGWRDIKDPEQRKQLRQEMKAERKIADQPTPTPPSVLEKSAGPGELPPDVAGKGGKKEEKKRERERIQPLATPAPTETGAPAAVTTEREKKQQKKERKGGEAAVTEPFTTATPAPEAETQTQKELRKQRRLEEQKAATIQDEERKRKKREQAEQQGAVQRKQSEEQQARKLRKQQQDEGIQQQKQLRLKQQQQDEAIQQQKELRRRQQQQDGAIQQQKEPRRKQQVEAGQAAAAERRRERDAARQEEAAKAMRRQSQEQQQRKALILQQQQQQQQPRRQQQQMMQGRKAAPLGAPISEEEAKKRKQKKDRD